MALNYIDVVNGDNGMALNYIDVVNGDNGMAWNYIDVVNGDNCDDNVSLGLDYRGISILCWYDIGVYTGDGTGGHL